MQAEVLSVKQQQNQQTRKLQQEQPQLRTLLPTQLTPLPIIATMQQQQQISVQLCKINPKILKSDTNKQKQQQKYQQEQAQHFATIRRVPSPHYYSGRCQ